MNEKYLWGEPLEDKDGAGSHLHSHHNHQQPGGHVEGLKESWDEKELFKSIEFPFTCGRHYPGPLAHQYRDPCLKERN